MIYIYNCDIPVTLPKKGARIKINENAYDIMDEEERFLVLTNCFVVRKDNLNKFGKYSPCYESYYTEPNIELYKKQLWEHLQSEISYKEDQIQYLRETIKLLERNKQKGNKNND